MVNQIDFEGWVKFAGKNLYDYVSIETHPLTAFLVKPPESFKGARGEYIRKIFTEAIEQLKPADRDFNPSLPEWRPYLILHQRFIEGLSAQDMAAALAISDRQLRRDQHRAINALTPLVWNILKPDSDTQAGQAERVDIAGQFDVSNTQTDPGEVIRGVLTVLKRRLEEERRALEIEIPPVLPAVLSDRVILRQILISLVNHALRSPAGAPVILSVTDSGPELVITVKFSQVVGAASPTLPGQDDLVETVRFWARSINARFEVNRYPGAAGRTSTEFSLGLPKTDQKIILIVDDQVPAINLFQRYLARTDFQVIGETDARQVAAVAVHLHPVLITLDVMMPKVDGWELLQTLKTNDETSGIPVLVCSAWEEPELAKSLGAAGFLKKPVTQKVFLEELQRIGILAQGG